MFLGRCKSPTLGGGRRRSGTGMPVPPPELEAGEVGVPVSHDAGVRGSDR
jgi:hypothetical protein